MTAADQPTTEPSAVERAWDDGARAALRSEGYEVTDHAAVLASNPHRLAPAPQPAADQQCTACDGRGDEGSTYMNSGKCQTCHGTGTQPAADTETEVQWGVRYPDGKVVTLLGGGKPSRGYVDEFHGPGLAIVCCTGTYTPWEEA